MEKVECWFVGCNNEATRKLDTPDCDPIPLCDHCNVVLHEGARRALRAIGHVAIRLIDGIGESGVYFDLVKTVKEEEVTD